MSCFFEILDRLLMKIGKSVDVLTFLKQLGYCVVEIITDVPWLIAVMTPACGGT